MLTQQQIEEKNYVEYKKYVDKRIEEEQLDDNDVAWLWEEFRIRCEQEYYAQDDIIPVDDSDIDFNYINKQARLEEKTTSLSIEWLNLFGRRSINNEVPGKFIFRILLAAALKDKVFYGTSGKTLKMLLHFCWLQNSGCLDGNTLIQTDKGNFRIKDSPEEFNVISYNFNKNINETKPAIKINTGKKEVYEIVLEDNSVIYATEEHKFFNKNGEEIIVKDLKTGDELLCQ